VLTAIALFKAFLILENPTLLNNKFFTADSAVCITNKLIEQNRCVFLRLSQNTVLRAVFGAFEKE
jgi:hypothetical protein